MRHSEQASSLEAARDTVYDLLDAAPALDEAIADALIASSLVGRYQGEGAVTLAEKVDPFALQAKEAIAFFERKRVVSAKEFRAVEDSYKSRVFTVSRIADRYVLDHLHASFSKALREGWTERQWLEDLDTVVAARGITDPGDFYWETVWRNNMQTAYQAGRYKQMKAVSKSRPYWRYVAVMDSRTRPQHRAFHGVIRRHDDGWWASHYPPNGHRCRCTVATVSERQLGERKWKATRDEELPALWPDPGFKGNPGTAEAAELAVKKLRWEGRRTHLLGNRSADLGRANDQTRTRKLKRGMGLKAARERALIEEVGRFKVSASSAMPSEGETWVEWTGFSQNEDTFKAAITRIVQNPRLHGLKDRLELVGRHGVQREWPAAWLNPEVAVKGGTGRWSELAIRATVKPEELQDLLDFWQTKGQLGPAGYTNAIPLEGGLEVMDLMVRGKLGKLPEGMARAWFNRRKEGSRWIEVLSQKPLDGWESAEVYINKGLLPQVK